MSGRPENVIQQNTFIATCCFFKNNDEEQLTPSDLIGKMEDFLKDTEYSAYDRRHMKRKLLDFYGQDIIISGGRGAPVKIKKIKNKKNPVIVTYRQTANSILRDYYNKPKDVDINLQKIQLIEAAARLLKTEIKENEVGGSKEAYPLVADLGTEN